LASVGKDVILRCAKAIDGRKGAWINFKIMWEPIDTQVQNEGDGKMLKKSIAVCFLLAIMMALGSTAAFAQDRNFSFSVTPSNDSAFSAPNPKDDNEQRAYIVTQTTNLIAADEFYYTVRIAPTRESYMACGWVRVYGNGTLTPSYHTYYGATTNLYLNADTDKYSVSTSGHWWS
jgi:hypothetical protein